MNPHQTWHKNLREYIEKCRETHPIPARKDLSVVQERQCQINGGTIIDWLKNGIPSIINERWGTLGGLESIDKEPVVVYVTDMTGLVAAKEILKDNVPDKILFILNSEWNQWTDPLHDNDFKHWIMIETYFLDKFADHTLHDLNEERRAKLNYPIDVKSQYWLHIEGTMWGNMCGRQVGHLWEWDGTKSKLLAERFTNIIF